jgi:hypothetical protein
MDTLSNQSMTADSDYPAPHGAFPVWSKVFTKPGEQTFLEITSHPEAKARAAYIWMFIAGTFSGLINSLLQFIVAFSGLQQSAQDIGGLPGSPAAYGLGGLLAAICTAPLTGLLSVIGFAITTSIIHATARFFGGQGNFDKLAYAFGAIAAPISVVSALLVPFNAIPFVVFCTVPVILGLSIYGLYLEVAAIKAVHRLGWGESAGALFLPTILFLMLCGVLFFGLIKLAGPSIDEFFKNFPPVQQ